MASKGEGKKGLCALHSRPSMDNIREQSLVNLTDIFLNLTAPLKLYCWIQFACLCSDAFIDFSIQCLCRSAEVIRSLNFPWKLLLQPFKTYRCLSKVLVFV